MIFKESKLCVVFSPISQLLLGIGILKSV